jgi:transposase
MPNTPDLLPDDIEALKALLTARNEELATRDGREQQLRDTISTLEQALSIRTLEIEQLKLLIAKLKRMQFGRKSEKIDRQIDRLEMRLEDLMAEEGTADAAQGPPASPGARQKSVRQPLPESLPREDIILEPAEHDCPACGAALKLLGEDVAEQLDIINAAFKVIRTIRRKKACVRCDCIVQAPAPSRPIERGIAGPGLLARVLVAKFADHQPLYRQSVTYARQGVELDRSTMARWVGACGALVVPLVGRVSIRNLTCPGSGACCRRMPMRTLTPSSLMVRSRRLAAWLTRDAKSTSFTSIDRQRLPPRHCAGLQSCMRSKHRSEVSRQMSADVCGKRTPGHYSRALRSGCMNDY